MTSVCNEGKAVIRPIAFKPLSSGRLSSGGEIYGSAPVLASRPGSNMTLYGSSSDVRESHAWAGHTQPASLTSSPPASLIAPLHRRHHSAALHISKALLPHSSRAAAPPPPPCPRSRPPLTLRRARDADNFRTRQSRVGVGGGGGGGAERAPAPSPADSGVSELGAASQRDRELSPHAGCGINGSWSRACSEERAWDRELHRLKAAHESRLRAGAQKTMKLEQLLMMQSYQLQQDKLRLQRDAATAAHEVRQMREDSQQLRSRLEETEWNLCQKTGEIALLKAQLKDAQNEKTSKGHEYLQTKAECRQLQEALERRETEILALKCETEEKDKLTKRLQSEVDRLKTDLVESENRYIKQKNCSAREVDGLKSELKELQQELSDVSLSGYEGIECGRTQRTGIYDVMQQTNEYHWNSNDSSLEDAEVQRLNGELPDCSEPCRATALVDRLKCELDSKETLFEIERRKWSEEKEKVLRYQKQLQLNYMQMLRKSRSLEAELESLRLELQLCHKNMKNLGRLSKTIEL